MSICVNLRLAEGVVEEIDEIVKARKFKSRAQFCEIAVYNALKELER
jgi:metal-responsive CopG/Arc/MetJ family transcriptional regulator